jgi:DNA adenine methylase
MKTPESALDTRPPLKWAGGKYRLLARIRRHLPPAPRLIEPFVGSGAVFLNLDYPHYTIADCNRDLINFYSALKKAGGAFVAECAALFKPENNHKTRYLKLREEFNATRDTRRKAALFLYLNKHGYNGLCRYNASGEFNVPFGRFRGPRFPEKRLRQMQSKLVRARILCADFEPVMRTARPGDVIYCDPPYVPLSRTSNFTSYHTFGFGEDDQRRLARCTAEMRSRGVTVLVSNHETPMTRDIYRNADRVESIDVRRLISCNGSKRELARELLALYSAA